MTTKQRYSAAIEDAIAKARFSRSRATVAAEDGAEAYAIPRRKGALRGASTRQRRA